MKISSRLGSKIPRGILFLLMAVFGVSGSIFSSSIVNLSARSNVGVGDNVAISGVIITGGSESLIFRGLGPSLPFSNRLADPFLQLYNSNGSLVAQNNNWKDSQQAAISATGVAPRNDLESAIRIDLAPGAYTAILTGVNGGQGIYRLVTV